MEQEDMGELVSLLTKKNYKVCIEITGQEYNEDIFRGVDFLSCDIKTPSSGVECNLSNIKKLVKKYDYKTQFKAVVANQKDMDFVLKVYQDVGKFKHNDFNLIITPCWPENKKQFDKKLMILIEKTIFTNNMSARLILQQHKVVYGPEKRGV